MFGKVNQKKIAKKIVFTIQTRFLKIDCSLYIIHGMIVKGHKNYISCQLISYYNMDSLTNFQTT